MLGFKSNIDYINFLFSNFNFPIILCMSEHWLHRFEHHLFSTVEYVVAESPVEEDVFMPRLMRGRSGVAILWSPSIDSLKCLKSRTLALIV